MSNTLELASTEPNIPPMPLSNNLNGSGSSAHAAPKWQRRFWDNENHVSLTFPTTEELDAAIDWLWSTSELRSLPRVHVGQNTMIVPADAVDEFRNTGFQFVARPVISMGDLSPEEANRVRKMG